ncbi:hypothetical protein CN931_23885 [Bacillus sp. AFS054943]|uniref:Replication protein n=1 Tax=Bacillus cereus TaxID=1396 RepID=A0A2C1LNL7_BACCE|nr:MULTISPECIES: hypothetical protein [Bacillus]PGL78057.1 hypothetical protein CN931_23885 [Bacillus sp. AFS054943]PGT99843.1 hypothetical protein COD19_18085 [Bacillus cereus]
MANDPLELLLKLKDLGITTKDLQRLNELHELIDKLKMSDDEPKKKRKKKQSVDITDDIYLTLFHEDALHRLGRSLGNNKGFELDSNTGNYNKIDRNMVISLESGRTIDTIDVSNGKKLNVIKKVADTVSLLDEDTADVYRILVSKWITAPITQGKEKGKAFISLEDIHFKYRRQTGKNKNSTLTPEQRSRYYENLAILSGIEVKIDITQEEGKVYEEARKRGIKSIETPIFRFNWGLDEDDERTGFFYDFDELGNTFAEFFTNYNEYYPIENVRLDTRYYKPAKRIIDELVHMHKTHIENGVFETSIPLTTLIEMADYEINMKKFTTYINRFKDRQLSKVIETLTACGIIRDAYLSTEKIYKKTFEQVDFTIKWNDHIQIQGQIGIKD